MGYLDDLKRQAAEITAQRPLDSAAFEPQRSVAAGRVVKVVEPH